MALEKILDSCFADAYIPHVYDLIYRYVFDVTRTNNYGGIPYDIYLRITQEMTVITTRRNTQEYLVNGKTHRLDGPAIIWPGGYSYYMNGKLHRMDGPAVIQFTGYRGYYIRGHYYTKNHYYDEIAYRGLDKI